MCHEIRKGSSLEENVRRIKSNFTQMRKTARPNRVIELKFKFVYDGASTVSRKVYFFHYFLYIKICIQDFHGLIDDFATGGARDPAAPSLIIGHHVRRHFRLP